MPLFLHSGRKIRGIDTVVENQPENPGTPKPTHVYADKISSDLKFMLASHIPTRLPEDDRGKFIMHRIGRSRIDELIQRASSYHELIPPRESLHDFQDAFSKMLLSWAGRIDDRLDSLYVLRKPNSGRPYERILPADANIEATFTYNYERVKSELEALIHQPMSEVLVLLGLSPQHLEFFGLQWYANHVVDVIRGSEHLDFTTKNWTENELEGLGSGIVPYPEAINETIVKIGARDGTPAFAVGRSNEESLSIEEFAFHIPQIIDMTMKFKSVDDIHRQKLEQLASLVGNNSITAMDSAVCYMGALTSARKDLIRLRNHLVALHLKVPPFDEYLDLKRALENWVDISMRFRELTVITNSYFKFGNNHEYKKLFRHSKLVPKEEVQRKQSAVSESLLDLYALRRDLMINSGLSPEHYVFFNLEDFSNMLTQLSQRNQLPAFVSAAW